MKSVTERLEKDFTIPCGPMSIRADSVCRKSLRDKYDSLLDRLRLEVAPDAVFEEVLQGNSKMLQDISGRL